MSATEGESRREDEIDARAKYLRQGDVFELPDLPFPFVRLAEAPEEGSDRYEAALLEETRFAIVSQTCDAVESRCTQPNLKLSPLIEVPPDRKTEAAKGYIPHLAPIPGLNAFADLRYVATFDKAVVTSADDPLARLASDEERDLFRGVVHRHFSRAALPDDLMPALAGLRKRLRNKKDKDSDEGRAVRAIDEIRVSADPGWDGGVLDVTVYLFAAETGYWSLLPEPTVVSERDQWTRDTQALWSKFEQTWKDCCLASGCVRSVDLAVERFAGFDADIYRQATMWDLGGMSPQPE